MFKIHNVVNVIDDIMNMLYYLKCTLTSFDHQVLCRLWSESIRWDHIIWLETASFNLFENKYVG